MLSIINPPRNFKEPYKQETIKFHHSPCAVRDARDG